jgi:ABC-type transport system involved in multi-copper enzyme maturation permease subunit
MTRMMTQSRTAMSPRGGFAQAVHAEWTKLRTVRGWWAGMLAAAVVTVLVGLISATGSHGPGSLAGSAPVGPDGEAVTDSFYFEHQSLTGDGSITTRVTSLTGLLPSGGRIRANQGPQAGRVSGVAPWAKAGVIIKESTAQGSAYVAMMVTGGHGVRMQWDFTHDIAGTAAGVSATSPRWLRLTRSGDTLTGYDSADGTHWASVGSVSLPGLPSAAQAGLFVTSPQETSIVNQDLAGGSGVTSATIATAVFDGVNLSATGASGTWAGDDVGGSGGSSAGASRSGGTFTVTGSGDIAPVVSGPGNGGYKLIEQALVGAFAGLLVMVVVGTMFMAAEYRRGMIRITLAAYPRRGQVLAAKAVVIGLTAFVAGLAGVAAALLICVPAMRSAGSLLIPASPATEVRIVVGTAALLAVAAVFALALGALLRRSVGAVTTAIVVTVLPYILGTSGALPPGPSDWLLRVTPAAAFAIQQSVPQYPQVSNVYSPANGYFPLAPWSGFAVLCLWAAIALAAALYLLRRRDA